MPHIPRTNSPLRAAKQEPYKKAHLWTKNIEEFLEKIKRLGRKQRKDKTERAMEVGQRTREEIVTWNQMTALKFQTEVKRKTTPASLWGMERQRGGEKERERERERDRQPFF